MLLSADWDRNVRRYALQKLAVARIAATLDAAGIAHIFFKGVGLAEQLYRVPRSRHVGDVDVLVGARAMAAAVQALRTARFACDDAILALPSAVRPLTMHVLRDIAFRDPATAQRIEVHSRLLFSSPISAKIVDAEETFRVQLPVRGGAPVVPRIGAGLLCYLLLHGAVSGWSRLKWAVDIHAILRRLEPGERAGLVGIAESCGATLAVRAGLAVVRDAFPGIALGTLEDWVDDGSGSRGVQRRVALYSAWLNEPDDNAPNPLHDRRAALVAELLLHDEPLPKLVTFCHGGLSAGLRTLGQTISRRRTATETG